MVEKDSPTIIISRGDVLGDTVVATPLFSALKKKWPHCKIIFLIRPGFFSLFDGHPHIDTLMPDHLPHRPKFKDWPLIIKQAKELKKLNADIFLGLWHKPQYAVMSWLAGIRSRVGHRAGFLNWLLYTTSVAWNPLDLFSHTVELNTRLLKPLGIVDGAKEPTLLATTEKESVDFEKRFPWTKDDFVAIHLDAGTLQRVLLDEHFVRLVGLLLEKKLTVVLFGIQRNLVTAEKIGEAHQQSPRIKNLVNQLDLSEVKTLISKSSFLIGSDSGPVHIATGFQKPVIVNYFNRIQNAFRWGPWRSPAVIVKSRHHCVDVCNPNICTKMDCREPIDLSEYEDAINRILEHRLEFPENQRDYWAAKTLHVGLFPEDEGSERKALEQNGLRVFVFPKKGALHRFISDKNINLILIPKRFSFFRRCHLEIHRRIASNNMHFFPVIRKIGESLTS